MSQPSELAPAGPDNVTEAAEKTKQEIWRRFRRGEPVDLLAGRYRVSPSQIRRIVTAAQLQRILQFPLDHIPGDGAHWERLETEDKAILGPAPRGTEVRKVARPPAGLPPYLASLYEVPLLSAAQEVHLFRKVNYLKYKARTLRTRLDPASPAPAAMEQIERLYHQAVAVKNEIIRANLRLVVSVAKRYAKGPEHLFQLISDGNMSLLRAVEKFDYTRGFKFSTYATWALVRNYARTIPQELRYQSRFRSPSDDVLTAAPDERNARLRGRNTAWDSEEKVSRLLGHLSDREQQLIRYRFGLGDENNPMTLRAVGQKMGITKERVRQLESRAIAKLRTAAAEEHIEEPESE
jgi:RNA polymerase primary sigma factor/RNA polymerase sigma factor